MILLAALGFFVFGVKTVPFQSLDRSENWKHPHQNTVGTAPPSQFTGKDPEEISISAELRPEVTGGLMAVSFLRQMAESGRPYPLIMGGGEVMGSFVITSIQEKRSELNQDGTPRAISLTIGLKKVSESAIGAEGKALLIGAGIVRNLIGV